MAAKKCEPELFVEDKETGISIRFVKCFDAAAAQEITDADVKLWQWLMRRNLERLKVH